MFSLLLHPELVDYPGFWVLAALLLAGVGVVLYIVGKLIRKAVSRGKGR
jgi:TRAP-type C4-dicarboxylate transport system permease small subunit